MIFIFSRNNNQNCLFCSYILLLASPLFTLFLFVLYVVVWLLLSQISRPWQNPNGTDNCNKVWSRDFQSWSPDEQTCLFFLGLDFSVVMVLKWWTMLTVIPNHKNPKFMKGIKKQYVFGNFGSLADDWIIIFTHLSKWLPVTGERTSTFGQPCFLLSSFLFLNLHYSLFEF